MVRSQTEFTPGMRSLIWLLVVVTATAIFADWKRPRYAGPLIGKWGCNICFSHFETTYRSDGIVVNSPQAFGEKETFETFEVDETHYPPIVYTTEYRGGKVLKGACLWMITPEGDLRLEPFEPGGPIPTKFPDEPNPLLYYRVPESKKSER